MTTVRRATHDDIEGLVDLGLRFLANTPYANLPGVTRESVRRGLATTIDEGVVFAAEFEGTFVGLCAGAMCGPWFAAEARIGVELSWWVDPEFRGVAGIRLLRDFEAWAIAQGAKRLAFSDLILEGETTAGTILERLGYRMVERTYFREVG